MKIISCFRQKVNTPSIHPLSPYHSAFCVPAAENSPYACNAQLPSEAARKSPCPAPSGPGQGRHIKSFSFNGQNIGKARHFKHFLHDPAYMGHLHAALCAHGLMGGKQHPQAR